jgi:pimeloyl-ACP methyl ester carboxylesterase
MNDQVREQLRAQVLDAALDPKGAQLIQQVGESVREQVCVFGARSHLVGTRTEPSGAARPVGFILLNAGVIHRIGPRRFNVKLARELGKQGFASLRFDLGGLGDSAASGSAASYEEQVCVELSAAMDALEAACGVTRFVIAGICSGAQAGLNTALQDPRVAGLWLLDGPAYPTFKAMLARLWLQWKREPLGSMQRWAGKFTRRLQRGGGTSLPSTAGNAPRGAPPLPAFADMLTQLDARGVQLYLMYSSDVLWQYSYQGQFRDTFKGQAFVTRVRCERLEEADHTLTALTVQRDVMDRIGRWAVAHW